MYLSSNKALIMLLLLKKEIIVFKSKKREGKMTRSYKATKRNTAGDFRMEIMVVTALSLATLDNQT